MHQRQDPDGQQQTQNRPSPNSQPPQPEQHHGQPQADISAIGEPKQRLASDEPARSVTTPAGNSAEGPSLDEQGEIGAAAQAANISGERNLAGRPQQHGGLGSGDRSGEAGERPLWRASGGGQIREKMEVVAADGSHVGTVAGVERDLIKLTRDESTTGEDQFVPLSLVDGVDGDRVILANRGDASFGVEADC